MSKKPISRLSTTQRTPSASKPIQSSSALHRLLTLIAYRIVANADSTQFSDEAGARIEPCSKHLPNEVYGNRRSYD